ncbi:MAG TPA: acyl-CoA dehydrogenase family protein [Myxococcales bacterium]|jgi:alkylation response protein AidB-like acyl-CoA dehydrogenase
MATGNFFLDNEDLLFHVKNSIHWEELVDLAEAGYTLPDGFKNLEEAMGFYREILEATGELAAKEIAPRAAKMDAQGTHLRDGKVVTGEASDEVFAKLKEMGLFGLSVPRELGGSNAPTAVYFVTNEIIARADVSTMTHYGFHGGSAQSMLLWSAKEGSSVYENGKLVKTRWEGAVREMAAGDAFGCMVLTEPNAGSDLGAIETRAVERDGKWYLTGEKIFITSGHGQYQFVIAKTEEVKKGADGLRSLSLFMVPKVIEKDGRKVENVKVTKVEEKIGHHGSATVSLYYENSVGELIGKRGQGFELMLNLMNFARVGVGFEAIGCCEAALRVSKAYAAERKTMGKPIDQHELIAEKLLDMETWTRALRALAFEALDAMELATKLDLKLRTSPPAGAEAQARLKSRQAKLARKARRLTPLLKYLAGEKSVEITRAAMQIHGGMGYIDETGVHKLLRDALVLPVYEGTSQIQALMATKDQLQWAVKDPGGFVQRLARARLLSKTARPMQLREVYHLEALAYGAVETLLLRIVGRKMRTEYELGVQGKQAGEWARYLAKHFLRSWDPKADFSHGLLHAERLTRMLADAAIAKVLAKQAHKFPERKKLADRFIRQAILRSEALAREIDQADNSVLEAIAERQREAGRAQ